MTTPSKSVRCSCNSINLRSDPLTLAGHILWTHGEQDCQLLRSMQSPNNSVLETLKLRIHNNQFVAQTFSEVRLLLTPRLLLPSSFFHICLACSHSFPRLISFVSASEKHCAVKTSWYVSQQDNEHSYGAKSTFQRSGETCSPWGGTSDTNWSDPQLNIVSS